MSGCGIFDGPQLSEKCLKVAVFGGLAVPHIWNHYWVGFWGHIYITVELGRTFLSLLLTSDSSNLGRVGFVQIGANLDLFELEMIFLLHPTSSHPTYKPYIFWKILVQGYQIWYYQVSHTQIHKYKYTNTQIQHITKCQKDPTCGIFMKRGLFRGIKNDIHMCLTHKYKNTNTHIHKYTNTQIEKYTNGNSNWEIDTVQWDINMAFALERGESP